MDKNETVSEKLISEVMTQDVLTCYSTELINDVISRMIAQNIGAIIVIDEFRKCIGIFTERDVLVRILAEHIDIYTTPISTVMSSSPRSIPSTMLLHEAFLLMQDKHFRHLPIIDDDKLVGIVSIRDINKLLWKDLSHRTQKYINMIDDFMSDNYKNLDKMRKSVLDIIEKFDD
jgi:CBS domain-containing protein